MRAWPCLEASRRHDPLARRPFFIDDGRECHRVGSVAHPHLTVLRALARGPEWGFHSDGGVVLHGEHAACTQALASLNASLRAAGLVVGWRDELFGVPGPGAAPELARIERAAARFWGTLTLGAHANGFVRGPDGHPTHLWIAQRALSKSVDPGLLDNLVGGGVPSGQTPFETLIREGWEEAGLDAATVRTAQAAATLRLRRDVPEGHQVEDLHAFDLELPAQVVPVNQDGEVAGFTCMDVQEAIDRAAHGELTVDAALVTLSFAWRHRLLPHNEVETLLASGDGQLLSQGSELGIWPGDGARHQGLPEWSRTESSFMDFQRMREGR